MTAPSQLRVLVLHEKDVSSTIFRLEKGWSLHFRLGPSLADKEVRVLVNHPEQGKQGPNRHVFREVAWQSYSQHQEDVYDNYAEVSMVLAGSFNYFFTIDGSTEKANAEGSGYFLVDPILKVGQFDEKVPLDSICCQTVLAKNMGPFTEWKDRLRVTKEAGYNMVHFTPIQELGLSNSAYCLKDQLQLNPVFNDSGKKYDYDDVAALVTMMKDDWEMLSLTDLVFNHTANESPWILQHPECSFNLVNSPHLKPAYLLDRILWHFSSQVARGEWEGRDIPAQLTTEEHLGNIHNIMSNEILPKHKIHEYFILDVEDVIKKFKLEINGADVPYKERDEASIAIIPDVQWRRLKATVDMESAIQQFFASKEMSISDKAGHVESSCNALRQRLEELNRAKADEVQSHLVAAVTNLVANAHWRFVDQNGEKIPKVLVDDQPIMWNYFTLPREELSVDEEEVRMHTAWGAHCMAHNGWVMGDDPLRNFAAPGSNVYLRRELIPWGDSVKLRYGETPEDCPFLWQQMREYVMETARVFHGVRLDNCHSTPIHVAEWMLDEARKVRPDLYVIAELFTSSEHMDNLFINRLGLNSLIREGLNAQSAHDQGQLVHRYGGEPVGAFFQPPARPLVPSVAHAIFFDQTHDNLSPVEKRTAYDVLPSAAVLAMGCFATGSNRGYDEIVPHHINVVKEKRVYTKWSDDTQQKRGNVSKTTGIMEAKRALNKLHQMLGMKGFSQVFVDKIQGDIVAVTRHNPVNHQAVVLVARSVFSHPHHMATDRFELNVSGEIEEVLFEGKLVPKPVTSTFSKDADFINGLQDYTLHFQEHFKISASEMVEALTSDERARNPDFLNTDVVRVTNFPPSSIIAFKVVLHSKYKKPVLRVRQVMAQFGYRMRTLSARNVSQLSNTTLEKSLTQLDFNSLNRVLYRCDAEEKDDGQGFGAYDVPGHGPLPYCGLQGVMSVLGRIRAHNDLGHPLCQNLRHGNWMCDYTANRLRAHPDTHQLGEWFRVTFESLTSLPRYLIPCYFDAIVTGVYMLVEEVAWAKMSEFVHGGSTFTRSLAMGSLQFCSYVPSATLPPVAAAIYAPGADAKDADKQEQRCLSLAAGLPHFASGIWRNWGRDTFIALRGLLLLTGREKDARYILLSYAGTLRHGLIPNLLGGGTHARFNCRDSVWWWLQCVQEYCACVPGGEAILQDPVTRMYPTDDAEPQSPGTCEQPLHAVIQEALQRHAEGIHFRERNAGPQLDNDMAYEGFDVTAGVDWRTGFVYGGNAYNCGTWMDKMGSSEKAGNKGQPATPRDGSAVELVGLCKAAVRWLADMNRKGHYPHRGVTVSKDGKKSEVTFEQWNRLIQENFEKQFWVGQKYSDTHDDHPELINQRCIYKDSVGASKPWTDYQLRPNFPIAMVVAPELFTPLNAWAALTVVENLLVGPLGMKTLDPSDWKYDGNYDNSNDSDDKNVARGWNYHQGPEWLWPLGFFLRAKLYFAVSLEKSVPGTARTTMHSLRNILSRHHVHIHQSEWRSLPELTNKDGAHCKDSCAAQAWSVACLLEVLYDLHKA